MSLIIQIQIKERAFSHPEIMIALNKQASNTKQVENMLKYLQDSHDELVKMIIKQVRKDTVKKLSKGATK